MSRFLSPLLFWNFSFIFDMFLIIFTLRFRDFIINASTSSSFFSFNLSIFSKRRFSNSFSRFSKYCCKVNKRLLLISSISFSFCFHSRFSWSFVNLLRKLKLASSLRGGRASLKALFSLAFSMSSMIWVSAGSPFPKWRSFNSLISWKVPSFLIFPKGAGWVWASLSRSKVWVPIVRVEKMISLWFWNKLAGSFSLFWEDWSLSNEWSGTNWRFCSYIIGVLSSSLSTTACFMK